MHLLRFAAGDLFLLLWHLQIRDLSSRAEISAGEVWRASTPQVHGCAASLTRWSVHQARIGAEDHRALAANDARVEMWRRQRRLDFSVMARAHLVDIAADEYESCRNGPPVTGLDILQRDPGNSRRRRWHYGILITRQNCLDFAYMAEVPAELSECGGESQSPSDAAKPKAIRVVTALGDYSAVKSGRQNVGPAGQIPKLSHDLFLVGEFEQVEIS